MGDVKDRKDIKTNIDNNKNDNQNKCVTCKEHYGRKETENKCSVCWKIGLHPELEKQRLAFLQALHNNITAVYIKNKGNLKRIPIPADEFPTLCKKIYNQDGDKKLLDPKQVYCLMNGFYKDKTSYVLTASQADHIFEILNRLSKDDDIIQQKMWLYVHAICPVVLDRWNLKTDNIVLECYYKDLGELTSAPTSPVALVRLWYSVILQHGHFYRSEAGQGDIVIDNCQLCHCDVNTEQCLIQCKKCDMYLHYKCANKWFSSSKEDSKQKSKKLQCLACSTEWENQSLWGHPMIQAYNLPRQCINNEVVPVYLC